MAKQVTNKDLFADDAFKKTTDDVSKLITEIKLLEETLSKVAVKNKEILNKEDNKSIQSIQKTKEAVSKLSQAQRLNAEVEKLAKAGKLLGISLKKIAKGGQATAKEFNKSNQVRTDYKYESWGWGKTGNFFSSQDIYMECDAGSIQFRTFNRETSWQGQITGRSAAGGKVSGGNVDYYCKDVFGKDIYGGRGGESPFFSQINKDSNWPSKAYELYKKHNSKSKPSVALIPKATFLEEWKGKEEGFRNSKTMCLMFLDVFEGSGTSKSKKDKVVTAMFRYASSAVDQSSYFVKIS